MKVIALGHVYSLPGYSLLPLLVAFLIRTLRTQLTFSSVLGREHLLFAFLGMQTSCRFLLFVSSVLPQYLAGFCCLLAVHLDQVTETLPSQFSHL